MDKEVFVQNVKMLCLQKGIKPTNACKESGVGGSFLGDINRGQTPSVAKVQLLAEYLGVTTSELLGETITAAAGTGEFTKEECALISAYRKASEDDRTVVNAALRKYQNV